MTRVDLPGNANKKPFPFASVSALDLLQQATQEASTQITTCSSQLDALLGGWGLEGGQITEFCGLPGIGKTQLGMQLCVSVQLPRSMGGCEGEAIYIDSEGSLVAKRLIEMAQSLLPLWSQAGRGI